MDKNVLIWRILGFGAELKPGKMVVAPQELAGIPGQDAGKLRPLIESIGINDLVVVHHQTPGGGVGYTVTEQGTRLWQDKGRLQELYPLPGAVPIESYWDFVVLDRVTGEIAASGSLPKCDVFKVKNKNLRDKIPSLMDPERLLLRVEPAGFIPSFRALSVTALADRFYPILDEVARRLADEHDRRVLAGEAQDISYQEIAGIIGAISASEADLAVRWLMSAPLATFTSLGDKGTTLTEMLQDWPGARNALGQYTQDRRPVPRMIPTVEQAAREQEPGRGVDDTLPNLPKVFMSYSHDSREHKAWVLALSTRLRADGVDVTLDQWHTHPGDDLPAFMERSIRDNDYVFLICTPQYKKKSEERTGGVGYEGYIMTAELYAKGNGGKFIPVLREGSGATAIPSWIAGKYRVDLHGDHYDEEQYNDLLMTIHRARPEAPPIGKRPAFGEIRIPIRVKANAPKATSPAPEPIRIKGVIVDAVTTPRNDGTRGSALYRVPFQLSGRPSSSWASTFIETWDRPPEFTLMHRPGIASVENDRVILDGTTLEEVEEYHRKTLKLVVERTNELVAMAEEKKRRDIETKEQQRREHEENVRRIADRLSFD